MKDQALFSSKDKMKKLKCHLLQFLFGALRVKNYLVLCKIYTDNSGINSYTMACSPVWEIIYNLKPVNYLLLQVDKYLHGICPPARGVN